MKPTVMRSDGAAAPSAPNTDAGTTIGAASAADAALTNCRRLGLAGRFIGCFSFPCYFARAILW